MTKYWISFVLFALAHVSALAQDSLTVTQQLENFDCVIKGVEDNYAGYPTKVNENNLEQYVALKDSLRQSVNLGQRSGQDAAAEYTGWFNDWHLFLVEEGFNLTQKYYANNSWIDRYKEFDYKPSKVACKVNDQTFLIRFPSCHGIDPDAEWISASIDSFKCSGCANIIIDIRGNNGGQDGFYRPYFELLYDHEGFTDGVEFRNSNANQACIEQLMQNRELPEWLEARIKRILASDAPFVLFTEERVSALQQDSISILPQKAAIIIDKMVASSAEQFVLEVKATSNRTTIYGKDNTLGCLDFSNVRPDTRLPHGKAILAIPMTRSCRLPGRGVDETGIEPDVRLNLPYPQVLNDNIDSWVLYIANQLEK